MTTSTSGKRPLDEDNSGNGNVDVADSVDGENSKRLKTDAQGEVISGRAKSRRQESKKTKGRRQWNSKGKGKGKDQPQEDEEMADGEQPQSSKRVHDGRHSRGTRTRHSENQPSKLDDEGSEGGDTLEPGSTSKTRLPKRKCALMLGFCGTGYNGMQMYVPSHLTI
jgi:hypothetical protein